MSARRTHILVELDGVLADGQHRSKEEILENVKFLIRGDKLNHVVSRMLKGFERTGVEIVIVAPNRSKLYEKETKMWLKDVGVSFDYLMMAGDQPFFTRMVASEKDELSESVLFAVIGSSNAVLSYGKEHPHKPTLCEIRK